MCEVLEISTSTYYKYRKTKDPDYDDYIMIKEIFDENKKTYGYRRIYAVLTDEYGLVINHKKVARIMKKYSVVAEYIKKQKRNYVNQYTEEEASIDLLKRNFNQRGWVTDITYLHLIKNGKKAYLSTIIDLETRDVVAYQISKSNDKKLVMDTLNKAITKTKDLNGLILHSDQGFQYLTTEFKIICASNGIVTSMSRKGTPLDNAVIESFHSILKKETLYNNTITTLDEYIQLVHEWIHFYNTKRRRLNKK
ncbi:Integrase core domain protein [Candidatus Izimaplasma bacterium HR1]|jgi:transposase InsO family protein|nr:Integrase core domain protein [Candidatus Izimaplasma bacterium HR1]AIO18496.1 Integrase core domain protein [Candidatus Izimaplasma bacterium HR1]